MIKIGVICSSESGWLAAYLKFVPDHKNRLDEFSASQLGRFIGGETIYEKFIAGTCLASRLKSYDRLTFSGIFTSDQIQGYLNEWGKPSELPELNKVRQELHNTKLEVDDWRKVSEQYACDARAYKTRFKATKTENDSLKRENSGLIAKLMTANRDLTAARNDLNKANRESASSSSRVDELTITVGTLKGQLCAARDELLKCREDDKRLALDIVDLKQILSYYQAKLREVSNTQVPRYVMVPTDSSVVEKLRKELVDLQASYDDLLSTKKRLEASLAETQRDHGKSFAEISLICDKHI